MIILSVMVAALSAGPLNQGERDYAMSNLHAGRKMLLDAIAGLSAEQWKFKPAPDRWSIAEIAEHATLTEDVLFTAIKKMLAAPPVEGRKATRAEDEKLLRRVTDRTEKAKNPEPTSPKGTWATPQELARAFRERRDRVIAYVQTTQDDLRSHVSNFGGGEMDAYQMLILIAGHTERHVAQIGEVKADPRYPK